jgi:hypothetical protein
MSYGEEREYFYQKEVERNCYRIRAKIKIIDEVAYLEYPDELQFLCEPLNHKKLWYETWLCLKEKHGDLQDFIKRP